MTYKGRKRLAIWILVVGLPIYILIASTIMSVMLNQEVRFAWPIEFIIYVGLGIGWVFPLKWVFKGIGQPDPDQHSET